MTLLLLDQRSTGAIIPFQLRSHRRKPSKCVGSLGDIAFHGHTLTLNCKQCLHRATVDLEALILANGADYLLRKIVDRAVCKECGGVEIGVTIGVAGALGYSYPTIARGDPPPAESRLPGQLRSYPTS